MEKLSILFKIWLKILLAVMVNLLEPERLDPLCQESESRIIFSSTKTLDCPFLVGGIFSETKSQHNYIP